MDRRRALLTQLLNSADMREFFPDLPTEIEEIPDSDMFRILDCLWPIVRETSDSDEECAEDIDMLVHVIVSLVDSGRL